VFRTDFEILVSCYVLETEELIKQRYEWQKCNMGVKSWAMKLKEE
jgi:hypothetical protein